MTIRFYLKQNGFSMYLVNIFKCFKKINSFSVTGGVIGCFFSEKTIGTY